ncbi:MAG: hypothetical protein ABIQ06_07770 [Caldimonas sp.]
MQLLMTAGKSGVEVDKLAKALARELGEEAASFPARPTRHRDRRKLPRGGAALAKRRRHHRRRRRRAALPGPARAHPGAGRPIRQPGPQRRQHQQALSCHQAGEHRALPAVHRSRARRRRAGRPGHGRRDALETDLRTPILGLDRVNDVGYGGWDGSSDTGEALASWRAAAKGAGLAARTTVVGSDRIRVAVGADGKEVNQRSAHGGFDNDIDVVSRTLTRITGTAPLVAVDDLRGY